MIDTIKNALLASLGLVALTQEKLKGFVDDLVKRGELTAEQGKKVFDELLKSGQTEGRVLSERIAHEVVQVLEKTPFTTRRELRLLEDRVRALEAHAGVPAAGGASSTGSPSSPSGSGSGTVEEGPSI
jgi:polyhydroxyalkanoate synthesis regulator phasin